MARDRKTTSTGEYECLEDLFISLALTLEPPRDITVSETAEEIRQLNNAGSYIGPWLNSKAPYLAEPMDSLDDRNLEGVCFVGPAQTGKTEIILNWLTKSVVFDPMDMLIYSPTQKASRDFSTRRIDRLHRTTTIVGQQLLPDRDADNKFDKYYRSGMILTLAHPTESEFAGKPVPRTALTDYDRMDSDVDGDGTPYDLANKRTTSFGSFGKTLAESSPSKPIIDPRWIRTGSHEAPPCEGILAIYNRGDRRRWNWPCPHCDMYFEGVWEHLKWETTKKNFVARSRTVYMECPNCSEKIYESSRHDMQQRGIWLKEGEHINPDGSIGGTPREAKIASFWMNGVAAAFTTWAKLVLNYLNAEENFEKTMSESDLKKFFNTDIGVPYSNKLGEGERLPEQLKTQAEPLPFTSDNEPDQVERARTDLRPMVPEWVRGLFATVDIGKNMFIVTVFGISPGEPFDLTVVDHFKIMRSRRLNEHGEALWVKPGSHLEDWSLIDEEVMQRQYELADGSGRRMQIKLTTPDSGGQAGATTQAYDFYRKLRNDGRAGRFHLLKGDPYPTHPPSHIVWPDSNRKDKWAAARGDVPVMMLNSNLHKDALAGRLQVTTAGKGQLRYGSWLNDNWFTEMCVEIRTPKGWQNPKSYRNEAWDLCYYAIGIASSSLLKVDRVDWTNPPGWLKEWDKNDLIVQPDQKERFAKEEECVIDFTELGRRLAG